MQRFLSLVLIALPLHVLAQPRMSATTQHAIAVLEQLAKEQPDARKLTEQAQARFPVMYIAGRCMVGFLGRATDAETIADEHISVGARAGEIVSFRVDAHHLASVRSIIAFDQVEIAQRRRPALNQVIPDIRADSVHWGIALPQGYTGQDVLLGISDVGFDFTHPAFYDTAMSATRIVAAWDQFKQSGPPPTGYGYGATYTTAAELIAAEGDTATYGGRWTHGTHVAGIAGGAGAGTPYRGVAYGAGLLFVTLNDDAGILDGFAWMNEVAQQQQKRLVINMSWSSMDLQDGTSLFCQAIDAFADQGIVFCAANGNNGGVPFHMQRAFAGDTLRTRIAFPVFSDPGFDWRGIILLGQPGAPFEGRILIRDASNAIIGQTPWMSTATQAAYTDTLMVFGTDTVELRILADAAHPQNQRPHLRVHVRKTSTLLRVDLNVTAPGGTVHGWNAESTGDFVGIWGEPFQAAMPGYAAGDLDYGVGEPACGNGVLAVGAYRASYQTGGNWQGGEIGDFSVKGPTLDGRLKPDITAPGVHVVSCVSSYTTESVTPVAVLVFQGRGYMFASWEGTSMSSPVGAGVAALLLEAFPYATPFQIRSAITDNARTDAFTGPIPPSGSTLWGMGKINAYQAVTALMPFAGVSDIVNDGARIWPNPADEVLHVTLEGALDHAQFAVLDLTGRLVSEGNVNRASPTIDVRSLAPGTYLLRITNGNEHTAHRFVKR